MKSGASLIPTLPRVAAEIKLAIAVELANPNGNSRCRIPDLFDFLRRCMLRVSLNGLLGSCILDDYAFVSELMEFQDQVEDATAKGAVLPRFVSVPLVLSPVQRIRKRLESNLAQKIRNEKKLEQTDARNYGPWLRPSNRRK